MDVTQRSLALRDIQKTAAGETIHVQEHDFLKAKALSNDHSADAELT